MSNEKWAETLSDEVRYEYEERAAIYEFDGGYPREQAEALARKYIEERYVDR